MRRQRNWKNRFEIKDTLGQGGNANVYYVIDSSTSLEYALKELYNLNPEKKVRFLNEIEVMKNNAPFIDGIIPIADSCEEEYWYTMPIAMGILKVVEEMTIDEIVKGVIDLSETLEKLHMKEITHRDIKPSNIYFYQERFSFGDFGLVDFPDNVDEFTKSDRGLGAIFTIAPEMKRNPKDADGKKADVFSLAKTLWMLLSGDDKGFDGTYNYFDISHSLRYMKKYRNTHLVELDELLKDATENIPDLRPTIKEFKDRLYTWIKMYSNQDLAQASDWHFLNKQLFGLISPTSAMWSRPDQIVEILNIVGRTPAYNHMMFSDGGGLDFYRSELASEVGCIKLFDTLGIGMIVKPKCLYYEGFDEYFRWNYFLLELEDLEPIHEDTFGFDSELLVEDYPAHYVPASYVQYGVYDYDKGDLLPEGYQTVWRYVRGKILIVMKFGPYNGISSAYDGRHGLCNNSVFRQYIDSLIKVYSQLFLKAKQDNSLSNIDDFEIETRILELSFFNKNPFRDEQEKGEKNHNILEKIEEEKKVKELIKQNYSIWCFKKTISLEYNEATKIKFCFKFNLPDVRLNFDFLGELSKYICKDGYIKELKSVYDENCYCVSNREIAISLKNSFEQEIINFLHQNGLDFISEIKKLISIKIIKCGKPTHLFTKEEIEVEMRKADDRVCNQLIIDEDGYAKVIQNNGYAYLFPVRHESWDAGNVHVGKYSSLLTLEENYIKSLQGWLIYLKTGKSKRMEYVHENTNVQNLLEEIKKYY